ncbi:MAG: prepilin-type N-terminal cleavage/methylation domain-containing protein [Verrucomicrobia bacterium]|nr:prepilin-type N-terminal cleavage/methylation domain-containing protein [Verrucomicrobiota bacterium]
MSKKKNSGFTLVEILVVMVVLGCLASVAIPSLKAGYDEAGRIKCASNLYQLGKGMLLYAADNGMCLPQTDHQSDSWTNSLKPYVGDSLVTRCPCDEVKTRARTYVMNDYLSAAPCGAEYLSVLNLSRLVNVERPSRTVFFFELSKTYGTKSVPDHLHLAEFNGEEIPPNDFKSLVGVERHAGRANYLFLDGHVEVISWSNAKVLINQTGGRFVDPNK